MTQVPCFVALLLVDERVPLFTIRRFLELLLDCLINRELFVKESSLTSKGSRFIFRICFLLGLLGRCSDYSLLLLGRPQDARAISCSL